MVRGVQLQIEDRRAVDEIDVADAQGEALSLE
jgi:hypothetical protein